MILINNSSVIESSVIARISQDFLAFHRIHFFYAAFESGLLDALQLPTDRDELIVRLGVKHPEILDSLLELGVLLEELSLFDGYYKITGQYTKLLMEKDALGAVMRQMVMVNGPVFRRLAERLQGGPPGDYLSGTGGMLAHSARLLEPLVADFLSDELVKDRPLNILEVGCGTGIYLKHAALINPRAFGVGLDMQEDVIKLADANLADWGIDDRFKVIKADIRHPLPELAGPFDVILLLNNIFYFTPAERSALLRC
ncbi:MAG: class I SAM-dependent methyltransferase, partial [Desulfotomaculaceae bacterium]|nr:class I SAM-dependent methyltransferase [Desulfotomaculaceae bacterium]